MDTRSKVIIVAIFLLIVAGMFSFAYLKRSELTKEEQPTPPSAPEEQEESPYDHIERINAKHFYIDGTHTLVGEVAMPTPCDLLNWDTTIAESYPEQVTVDFSVINESDTCAQVITDQRFKVSFDASEDAQISARLNERDIELNLIPAEEGETPEDYELFIKG